jgi:CheY-like chemotaxis protein
MPRTKAKLHTAAVHNLLPRLAAIPYLIAKRPIWTILTEPSKFRFESFKGGDMPGGGNGPGNAPGARVVLIVDDDVVCRLFCRQTLAPAGYEVLECCKPADAIAHSVRLHPAVILLDLRLHDANGCHVAADILRTWPAARATSCIVGMTADHAGEARTELLQAGCCAVLLKPFSSAELLTVIARSPGVISAHERPVSCGSPVRSARVAPGIQPPPEPGLQTAFLGELRRQLPALDRAVTALDWHEAEHVLHRITGGAALAGFGSLSREARALLRQIIQRDDEVCLVERYLELLTQAAALLRLSPAAGDGVLRQI